MSASASISSLVRWREVVLAPEVGAAFGLGLLGALETLDVVPDLFRPTIKRMMPPTMNTGSKASPVSFWKVATPPWWEQAPCLPMLGDAHPSAQAP